MVIGASRPFVAARAALTLAVPALVAAPRMAAAHPLHTSYADVTYEPATRTLSVSLRVFADDFSADVTRRTGAPAGGDGVPPVVAIARYLATRFTLVGTRGEARPFRSCGIRRVGAQLFVCLRVDGVDQPAGLRLRNEVLGDVFSDQVNVVQVANGSRRRTLLFSPGDGAKPL